MKILVTGANGFIGRALCKKMIIKGYQVRGAVRNATQMTGLPSGVEAVNVGNICLETNWSKALNSINGIVHLAAQAHIFRDNSGDPYAAFREINVVGTKCLAQQAVKSGVKRFVYLSTVKVIGEGTEGKSRGQKSEVSLRPIGAYAPVGGQEKTEDRNQKSEIRGQEGELKGAFSEKDIPEPQDPYAVSKWEAEQVLHDISQETGMEIVILRSPLVYGPRVKANFLRLLELVKIGIPLPLASVNNKRSMIYLGNLVDAIVTCMKNPRASGQTYFVSDGEDVSTPELIRRISSALGRPVRLFPFPTIFLKIAGIITGKSVAIDRLLGSLMVDSSKIRRELDWQAPFLMEQGLRETAMWYLKRRNISRKGAKTLR